MCEKMRRDATPFPRTAIDVTAVQNPEGHLDARAVTAVTERLTARRLGDNVAWHGVGLGGSLLR